MIEPRNHAWPQRYISLAAPNYVSWIVFRLVLARANQKSAALVKMLYGKACSVAQSSGSGIIGPMYQEFLESKRSSCQSNITICQSAGKRVRGECRRHVVELSHFESSMPSQMILKATPHYNVRSSNATAVHFNTLINSMRNSDALMNLHVLHRSDLAGQLICEYF